MAGLPVPLPPAPPPFALTVLLARPPPLKRWSELIRTTPRSSYGWRRDKRRLMRIGNGRKKAVPLLQAVVAVVVVAAQRLLLPLRQQRRRRQQGNLARAPPAVRAVTGLAVQSRPNGKTELVRRRRHRGRSRDTARPALAALAAVAAPAPAPAAVVAAMRGRPLPLRWRQGQLLGLEAVVAEEAELERLAAGQNRRMGQAVVVVQVV